MHCKTFENNQQQMSHVFINYMHIVAFDWPNGKWLKANVQQRGYYIVNYDKDNWEILSSVLKNNHKV